MFAILMVLLGEMPLSYAIFGCGSTSVVRFFPDHGLKPNKADINGLTALHYPATTGYFCPCACLFLFLSPVALFILRDWFGWFGTVRCCVSLLKFF